MTNLSEIRKMLEAAEVWYTVGYWYADDEPKVAAIRIGIEVGQEKQVWYFDPNETLTTIETE